MTKRTLQIQINEDSAAIIDLLNMLSHDDYVNNMTEKDLDSVRFALRGIKAKVLDLVENGPR